MAGIGPGPMCAMLLAELGATVLRLERKEPADLGIKRPRKYDLLLRSRPAIGVDLKTQDGVDLVKTLVGRADGLIEGFRPGVMERLGLGPDICQELNPRLVYGRITGWGQDGPLAHAAGHDLNYIALTGGLAAFGRAGQAPTVPLTVIGDFGGGALYLALGMLAGLIEARGSGRGQVVDAAMLDGAMSLFTVFYGLRAAGVWRDGRGTNLTDSGSHFCEVYECADGKWISIGSIEAKFHAELLEKLGLEESDIPDRMDRSRWVEHKKRLTELFLSKTRDEWCAVMEGSDVCFAPVLSMAEAPNHPHNVARGAFVEVDGVIQPGPAPRFSRTPGQIQSPPPDPGQHSEAILADWGWSADAIAALRSAGAIG